MSVFLNVNTITVGRAWLVLYTHNSGLRLLLLSINGIQYRMGVCVGIRVFFPRYVTEACDFFFVFSTPEERDEWVEVSILYRFFPAYAKGQNLVC